MTIKSYNGEDSMTELTPKSEIYLRITEIISASKKRIFNSLNSEIVKTYWMIGKEILEEEQQGQERAKYGSDLINKLSKKLTVEFGKGFTARNLWQMRKFYELYSIPHALRAELSWTHFRSLIKIEDPKKRSFYEIETISNNWSTRELERQINSLLYERLAISKDKNAVQELAIKGQELLKPEDLVKDPYILEFLGLPQSEKFFEADLESALIEHLQKFLLELGKGFSFVARQKRISLDDENFYIDLVFYNYVVKCFVLLDLKIGKLTHQDIGQMQMYVNYYTRELMNEGDNKPIGIILCADKSEAVVKYTLADDNRQIFASKYQLHLPTEEELREELIKEKDILEAHLDASFGDTLNVH